MRAFTLVSMALLCCHALCAESGLEELIRAAGNAGDEAARLDALEQILALPELPENLKRDAEALKAEALQWLRPSKLEHFKQEPLKTGDYDLGIPPDSPLYPLTWLYRGRAVAWTTLEYGGYWSLPEKRRAQLDLVRGYFEKAQAAYPDNALIRMYLGEPVPARKDYPAPESAPAWARHQREGLERLSDIIEWWIENRQQPDAQYGGGWGDDCEMWRWWVPILIAFEHPAINEAQTRFSEALWTQGHMSGGYTSRMSDVEHTAEDSADTLVPMMHLRPDDAAWNARTTRLVELAEQLWMGRNERGFLQFKSTYFTVDKVAPDPRKACDSVYHPRALQPALLLWQRNRDPRLAKLFLDWMDTWVQAALVAERGKPAGIVPSAIHWPDGDIGGQGPNWWDPENHNEDPLYVWPSAMGQMLNTLLQAHLMSGKRDYLEPLLSMAKIRLDYLNQAGAGAPEPGTAMWCGSKLESIAPVAAKYRLVSGRHDFDALLEKDLRPYTAYRVSGNLGVLTEALAKNAQALGVNFAGYTSEVRYTDRVLRFPSLFQENGMYPAPRNTIEMPDPALLYATATGDPDSGILFPANAVRWKTPPRDIAALVSEAGEDRFEARLFHFGNEPRSISAEFFLLGPGAFTAVLSTATGDKLQESVLLDDTRVLPFELPAGIECILRLQPEGLR